jgi:hypothetical protein
MTVQRSLHLWLFVTWLLLQHVDDTAASLLFSKRHRSKLVSTTNANAKTNVNHKPNDDHALIGVPDSTRTDTSSSTSTSTTTPPTPPANIERGKHLKYPFETEDVYNIYRQLQQDYHAKAFTSKGWKTLVDKKGCRVSMLPHPSDPTCPYVKMQATMPVSVEECWNFLKVDQWDRTMPKMDPFYAGVSIHGEFYYNKIHMILCRKRTQRILAFGPRDLTFLSVQDRPLSDGTWVSGSVSVTADNLPRQPGYTRAFQDSVAFYQPRQNNTATDVTILCRIDLNDSGCDGAGGFIPMWLYVKTIGITGANSINRMRNALVVENGEDILRLHRDRKQQLHGDPSTPPVAKESSSSSLSPWPGWWKAPTHSRQQEMNKDAAAAASLMATGLPIATAKDGTLILLPDEDSEPVTSPRRWFSWVSK